MTTKRTYKTDEVGEAVEQVFRLKVAGWTGVLKLETDGKKIHLTQYPSASSWMANHETIFELGDDFDAWFESGIPNRQRTLKTWEACSWDYVDDAIAEAEEKLLQMQEEALQ